MEHNYVFEHERIILKPLEETDIEQLRTLRNSRKQFFITQNEINSAAQKKWYESYLKNPSDIMFKVVKKDKPEEFIGTMALYDIDWERRTAECGRTLVDKLKAPERGIGTEVTKAICLFGFQVLKLNKIVAEVLKTNVRIIKAVLNVGFRIVGEDENLYFIELTNETINV